MTGIKIAQPTVASRVAWLTARKQLLAKEKDLTRQRDTLNRQCRFTKESIAKEPAYYNFEPRQSRSEGEEPGTSVKGRNENGPAFNLTDWVRHHDKYDV